ncbi:OmpA family protein [Croceivirga thetidis]|uniref:OmpA family protein n=1 Tax=Croceivirga thetidis TaxID=2721623 RepID=A0ABX1GR04_9FLAO|nr:OmpA family protein [Croceivirga thetidis]NKI31212.1 OmpA family protein [Croceivirga thetidis]
MFKKLIYTALLMLPTIVLSQSVVGLTTEDENIEAETVVDLPFYSSNTGKIDGKTAQKLEKKGDEVYQQMWYAEAAQYYEAVANYNKGENPPTLLQKLGNSYYFISNFERAFKWYHELFLSHRSFMNNQTLFRYGQSLKGVEKYNQASRVFGLIKSSDSKDLNRLISSKKNNNSITLKTLTSNSENSDFSPTYYSENKLVFASARDSSVFTTRKYRWNNQPYLDLYIGEIDSLSADLTNVKKFSGKVNSKYHEAGAAFSPDGKTMFFTRNNYSKKLKRDSKGVNHLTLFTSKFVGGEWSKPLPLPFNSDEYSTGHPAMSPDGKKLYFASDMPGGFGETDIYVVDVNGDGTFSEPKNLGKTVNSKQKEMFPYATENTIYFSSNRKLGFGGLDIYQSNYVQDIFEVAVNLGPPINSSSDDFSYIVDENTNKGYFASNRKGGQGDDDIYAFTYVTTDDSDESTILLGTVIDQSNGTTLANTLVQLFDKDGNYLKESYTDEFGSFEFVDLNKNTKYELRTAKEGYEKEIKLANIGGDSETTVNLILKDMESLVVVDGDVTKLKTEAIFFDFDSYELTKEGKKELKRIKRIWNDFPNLKIKIESHTDSRGSRTYNRILSQKRADATKAHLLKIGVEPDKIESAIGYGEDRISNDCGDGIKCNRDQHQNNRRSDLIVVEH